MNGSRLRVTHGILSQYKKGCRCEPCKAAKLAKSRRDAEWRQIRAAIDPSIVPHGRSGYRNWACRCDVCREAVAAERRGEYDRYCRPVNPAEPCQK